MTVTSINPVAHELDATGLNCPLPILRTVVRKGGVPVGGTMPGFGEKLDVEEIDAILAWVQSHWSDEIYALWRERDAAAR